MTRWPIWFEGKEVTKQDLFGLERFLLHRTDFVWGEIKGVDRFDLGMSLQVSMQGGTTEVRCRDLAGISTAGHPVVVGEEDLIYRGPAAEIRADAFNVWIEVNPDVEEDSGEKFQLVASSTRRPVDDHLNLGQFRFDGVRCDLVTRPRVRRLCAITPNDDAWRAWVRPLQDAMESRMREAGMMGASPGLAGIAYVSYLSRLGCEWAYLTIPELQRQIHVSRALGARESLTDPLPMDLYGKVTYPLTDVAPPDEWPRLLADAMTEGARAMVVEEVEDVGFGTVINKSQGTIGLRDKDQVILVELLVDMSSKNVFLMVGLECRPPLEASFITVGKDPATGKPTLVGRGTIQGTVRSNFMTYPLTPTPQVGHIMKLTTFSNLGNPDLVKLSLV